MLDIYKIAQTLSVKPSGKNSKINKFEIDSRKINKGDVFIAIKGENHDGNDFIKNAIDSGAIAIIYSADIELKNFPTNINFFKVDDTIIALQNLASTYRNILSSTKLIAITGSVGKTSTKEITALLFKNVEPKTFYTTGNFNSQIGLPLTLLNIPSDTKYIILEMGMSLKGEIEILTKIAQPDIAVITNIEAVHLANFKNIDGIADAKSEIFLGLKENGKVLINKDNSHYNYILKKLEKLNIATKNIYSFSNSDKTASSYLYNAQKNYKDVSINANANIINQEISYKISTLANHQLLNSIIGLSLIKILGLDIKKASLALTKYKESSGRGDILKIKLNHKFITIINDCYNASFLSISKSLENLQDYKQQNKDLKILAILGDMLELGDESKKMHENLAPFITKNTDKIITIGSNMHFLYKLLENDFAKSHFSNSKECLKDITKQIQNYDVILLKGSRGMHLEYIIEELKKYAI